MTNPFKRGDFVRDKQTKGDVFIVLDSSRCPFAHTCEESTDSGRPPSHIARPCRGWLLRILLNNPEKSEFLTGQRTVQCSKYYEVVNESNRERS